MAIEFFKEKWVGKISEVIIGSDQKAVKVGGESSLPFLFEEGQIPNRPVIAMEIWDTPPTDWPDVLNEPLKDVLDDPAKWATKALEEFKVDLVCLRLQGAHPDSGDKKPEEEAKLVESILKAVNAPLIIIGCGDDAKDNLVLPQCCEAAKGKRCLVGDAVQDNYKTLAAACLADGHNIVAQSPIDINIAKQLNILITDMGLPIEKIIINPTIGSLGYGLEYAYSIMERARLAALCGDKMLAMPFICMVGQEAWRAKEAKALKSEFPEWGDEKQRGPMWEFITASALLQAGADILVMRHPKAISETQKLINELMRR